MTKIKLQEYLKHIKPKVGSTAFIAIDGHGGAGKSTLSAFLAKKLSASVIHTDDFASWDNPLDWWPLVIDHVFKPISYGVKRLTYPRSSWWQGHDRQPISQKVTPYMILDGVSSLRSEFRSYISLGIFVETPAAISQQRGITRDLEHGESEEKVRQLWQTFYQQEQAYIQRDKPKEYAEIVLDGTQPFEKQITI